MSTVLRAVGSQNNSPLKQNDQEEVADKDYTGPWYYYIGASRSKRLRIERDHGVKFGNQEGGIEQDQEQGGDQDQDGELGERGQDEDEQRFQACNVLKYVRPVSVVSIEAVKGGRADAFKAEEAKTLSLMHEHGARYVRGGSNSNFNLTMGQEHYIERYLRHVNGNCVGCGGADHYAAQCPTTTMCYRCNQMGHQQASCPGTSIEAAPPTPLTREERETYTTLRARVVQIEEFERQQRRNQSDGRGV